MPPPLADFLASPGLAGPYGALMDECARAAEALCLVVETVAPAHFLAACCVALAGAAA